MFHLFQNRWYLQLYTIFETILTRSFNSSCGWEASTKHLPSSFVYHLGNVLEKCVPPKLFSICTTLKNLFCCFICLKKDRIQTKKVFFFAIQIKFFWHGCRNYILPVNWNILRRFSLMKTSLHTVFQEFEWKIFQTFFEKFSGGFQHCNLTNQNYIWRKN